MTGKGAVEAPLAAERPVEEIQRAQLVAKEVLRRIKEHPDTYYQDVWVEERGVIVLNDESTGELDKRVTVADWERCGTRACVAGHAAHVDAILPGAPDGTRFGYGRFNKRPSARCACPVWRPIGCSTRSGRPVRSRSPWNISRSIPANALSVTGN